MKELITPKLYPEGIDAEGEWNAYMAADDEVRFLQNEMFALDQSQEVPAQKKEKIEELNAKIKDANDRASQHKNRYMQALKDAGIDYSLDQEKGKMFGVN